MRREARKIEVAKLQSFKVSSFKVVCGGNGCLLVLGP